MPWGSQSEDVHGAGQPPQNRTEGDDRDNGADRAEQQRADDPLDGWLAEPPTPAVKMSMSCWMRWSGLSIFSSMNRTR